MQQSYYRVEVNAVSTNMHVSIVYQVKLSNKAIFLVSCIESPYDGSLMVRRTLLYSTQ